MTSEIYFYFDTLEKSDCFYPAPEGNSQIFLLSPFRAGVNQEKNRGPFLVCQSRIMWGIDIE
jgi:hypothetical protein